ncbi:MAG: nucleotide exchange factor GrpE [Candidatus Eremiobacteraeota bacterium]|nr:nucleotide exchange factor GrpE [Candidatus Eremiobacteraeota bacterium]
MNSNADTSPVQERPAPDLDLLNELEATKAKADENYNKFLYAMADFENYKKRIERQIGDIASAGKRQLLLKLLPVVDNLERALAVDKDKEKADSDPLREGLLGTLKGFEQVLASEGVRSYSVIGDAFDPKLAEAIGTKKADGVTDETVVEQAERGYKIGEDVLRPAKVIVAKSDA